MALRVVVLTGAPCSGKSTTIEHLKHARPNIQTQPELASLLIHSCGFTPKREDCVGLFEKTLYSWQIATEDFSKTIARLDRRDALIFDRGCLDPAAFLPGGADQFFRLVRTNESRVYNRYDRVIQLAPVSEALYADKCRNNPARVHSFEEALESDQKLTAVWSNHPGYVYVPDALTWDEKLALIMAEIDSC